MELNQPPPQMILLQISLHEWNEFKQMLSAIYSTVKSSEVSDKLTDKEYLTVKQVLEMYHISRSTFEKLKNECKIKIYKIRGKVLIKRSEIDTYIFKNKV